MRESGWSIFFAGIALGGLAAFWPLASFSSLHADPVSPPTARAVNELQLVDLEHLAVASIETNDAAVVKASDQTLRVKVGHTADWPGITLRPSGGHWNLSSFAAVALEVKNCGTQTITIRCRADDAVSDGQHDCVYGNITLNAGASGELRVDLLHKPAPGLLDASHIAVASSGPVKKSSLATFPELFGMRGYPVEFGNQVIDPRDPFVKGLDADRVTRLLVFADRTPADQVFEISHIRAVGTCAAPALSANVLFPLIDSFGQYMHREWPGKLHSAAEFIDRAAKEREEWARYPGPQDWDQYGGWATGPSVASTGFFRTQKVLGKWWLVDPEGKLFFSHGVDCAGRLSMTPTDGRDRWFDGFADLQNRFHEMFSSGISLKGYYSHKAPHTFSFAASNLKRKYGQDWEQASATVVHRRLRSWGMNTLGAWSEDRVICLRQTPYVVEISASQFAPKIVASQGYWGRLVDPFDPQFSRLLKEAVNKEAARSAADPWCIGYFVDNELPWANSSDDDTSLALATLRCPASQPAKRAFADDLRRKYSDVASLDRAWGTRYLSWNDLLDDRRGPNVAQAHADLSAFYSRLAEQYFATVRGILKSAAPNHLYLGCRFAWYSPKVVASAARYCDVLSFNLYRRSVADFRLPQADVPMLIGEFDFGAVDRGLFDAGLVPTENQLARADAYRNYVRGALANPAIVGCHWFQYRDEPTTGRVWDGENYQVGLVDITDTPYPETITAVREMGYSLYERPTENHLVLVRH